MKAKTVKEVLIAARWMIDNVGWCQGKFAKNADGGMAQNLESTASMCLAGAINRTIADFSVRNDALNRIREAVGQPSFIWNDVPWRTKQQVLDLLDRLIQEEP